MMGKFFVRKWKISEFGEDRIFNHENHEVHEIKRSGSWVRKRGISPMFSMKKGIVSLILVFCVSCTSDTSFDIRNRMLDEYMKKENLSKDEMAITKFAYIGNIKIHSTVFYVVELRTVIKGMLSPRGNNFIFLFDSDYSLKVEIPYNTAYPLWCEGSKVYLWGAEFQEGMFGNVWEFKDGIQESERKLIEIQTYGSYKSDETL